jgi:hypothetical protein
MAAIGAVLSFAGTLISAAGQMQAAKQQQAAANWQALEYERQGKAERAGAQAEALEEGRRRDLALSRLQTVAAASGFSATDPTALDLSGDIAQHGTYRAQLRQFGGEDRAAGLRSQAQVTRMQGQAAATAARARAVGSIISGFGGLARYGGGGSAAPASGGGNYYGFG